MPQSVFVQVGQCGNQIGTRFWELALREHATYNRAGVYNETMGAFFRNVDMRYDPPLDIPPSSTDLFTTDPPTKIRALRARGILVDMEESVVDGVVRGDVGALFGPEQRITAQSGCGNNWAVGHMHYGPLYRERILESVRKQVEHCDALQSFFLCHSMGGGTGSGLGTYILNLLADHFPDAYRFATVVTPSTAGTDNDVVTSPYNTILALAQLSEHADCVMPVDNRALADITTRVQQAAAGKAKGKVVLKGSAVDGAECEGAERERKQRAFDTMNAVVANVMLNVTASMRFEGPLNVDINEISQNLVPFPRMKYLVSSLAPLYALSDVRMPERGLDQMFTDAFSREHQLLKVDPRNGTYLACALMVRGTVEVSDVRRNIEKIRKQLTFVPWNADGWKTGICSVPPVGQTHSLLTLANNTAVTGLFHDVDARFTKLYKLRAHLHHYLREEGMDESVFEEARVVLGDLVESYEGAGRVGGPNGV